MDRFPGTENQTMIKAQMLFPALPLQTLYTWSGFHWLVVLRSSSDLPLVLADCHLSHINSLTINDDRITTFQPRCSACSSAIKESDKTGPWLCACTCGGDPIPSCERRITTQIMRDTCVHQVRSGQRTKFEFKKVSRDNISENTVLCTSAWTIF